MKNDFLVWVLCIALLLVGFILGYGVAVEGVENIFSFIFDSKEIVIGAVVAITISHFYYKKSGSDLKATADKLEIATAKILRYQDLKNKGFSVDLVQDKDSLAPDLDVTNLVVDGLSVEPLLPIVKRRGKKQPTS